MPVSKSDLIKQLKKIYPNLLKKDLLKIFDIFINEIKLALKNNERVELRGWAYFIKKLKTVETQGILKQGKPFILLKKKI